MQCFARWKEDKSSGVFFRDQTILQFGNSWDLLVNLVLLNPGSALPKNYTPCDELLKSKNLPFLVESHDDFYFEFSVDRLMSDLLKIYSDKYSGGVLKLYNLFNLKNQKSGEAIFQFKANIQHPAMFTRSQDVLFGAAPVVIATGRNAMRDQALVGELKKYIVLAEPSQLFNVSRVDRNLFEISRTSPDANGLVAS